MNGKLNIVATPIGNYADMTIRGLRLLNESDVIVCEEFKIAVRLLRFFGIKKELLSLNEHNKKDSTQEVLNLLLEGKTVSLISDCGTPGFADPGHELICRCIEFEIGIEFCGGANSVMAALPLSGFDISRFYYAGFVSPKSDQRRRRLADLSRLQTAVVLLETPYRLRQVLSDIGETFGGRQVFAGFDLTMESEKVMRGTAAGILEDLGEDKKRGEFVIIIDKP